MLDTTDRSNPRQVDGSVLCRLGTLAPGASATVRIVVQPTAPGPVTDIARVSGAVFDPVVSNVVATAIALALPARARGS
jgi:hypothetical protein